MASWPASRDWRLYKDVVACNKYLYENKQLTDFTLTVGSSKTKIQVHRYILMSRSNYFGSTLEHCVLKEWPLPHVEPDIFNVLLKYMYYECLEVDPSQALSVLSAALQYEVHGVASHCLNMVKQQMNADSVSLILSYAYVHEDEALKRTALEYFYANSLSALNSSWFTYLCNAGLKDILKSGRLNLRVERVFDYVLKWAEAQCKRQGKTSEPIYRRLVCGHEVISAIKFEEMDPKFFAEHVSKSSMLNQDEELEIYRKFLMNPNRRAPPAEELEVTSSSGPMEEQQTMPKATPPAPRQQSACHQPSDSLHSSLSSSLSRENSMEAASAMLVSGQNRASEPIRQGRVLDPRTYPSSVSGTRPVADNVPMSTNVSMGPKIDIQRFGGILSGKAYMRDNHDGISFISSHRIKLHGIYVYGSHQVRGKYVINMKILEDTPSPAGGPTLQSGRPVKVIPNKELETDGRQKQYLIEITPSLELKSETLYTVDMVMKGPVSFYGRSGQDFVMDDDSGVTITFIPYELALGGTNTEIGQLPGLVIEKCDY